MNLSYRLTAQGDVFDIQIKKTLIYIYYPRNGKNVSCEFNSRNKIGSTYFQAILPIILKTSKIGFSKQKILYSQDSNLTFNSLSNLLQIFWRSTSEGACLSRLRPFEDLNKIFIEDHSGIFRKSLSDLLRIFNKNLVEIFERSQPW